MDSLLLKFLLLFKTFWLRLGVDPAQLETIVTTKLLIDKRRPRGFNKTKSNEFTNAMMFISYLLVGGILGYFLAAINDIFFALSLYLLIWLVMLTFTLISDFTEVLFDVRDNYIILPQPVSDQTISFARVVHIVTYLFKITVPFILIGLGVGIYFYGILFGLLLIIQVLLLDILAIFMVNIAYLVILSRTTGQRFKEIINRVQIVFIILIIGGYYTLPAFIDFSDMDSISCADHTWIYFLPSTWIAALHELLLQADFSWKIVSMSLVALATPFIAIMLIAKFFSRQFSQKLMGLGEGTSQKEKASDKDVKSSPFSLMNFWSNLVTRDRVEQGIFDFVWQFTSRDRSFKLRVYPFFAMMPCLFIYSMFQANGEQSERVNELMMGNYHMTFLYFCVFGAMGSLMNSAYSDKHKASIFYFSQPVAIPGYIMRGNTLLHIFKYALPFFTIIALIVLAIWGFRSISDIILAIVNLVLLMLLGGRFLYKELPFSVPVEKATQGGKIGELLMISILLVIVGFVHYFFRLNWWFYGVYLTSALIFIVVIYRSFETITWKSLGC